MANLRTTMDSCFFDQNLSTPQTLHSIAKSVPGQPLPLDGARASKLLRFQQFALLQEATDHSFSLIPSFFPCNFFPDGSFSIQSLILCNPFPDGWLGSVGQFRPVKLLSSIKNEFSFGNERKLPAFKDVAKHVLDKSLYSIGLRSCIPLAPSTSLLLSTEAPGDQKGIHNRALLFHQLPSHDVTVEAAWPELFVDSDGKYWHVPESMSLDLASLISDSGLRYRFGIHSNRGQPQPAFPVTAAAPPALLPGLCAKAAFSYEKSKDLWREKVSKRNMFIERKGEVCLASFDLLLREPHATVSTIIGGTCGAWLGGFSSKQNKVVIESQKRSPLFADVFGSVCCTLQLGMFRKSLLDLSRIDARLDLCSASSLIKGAGRTQGNSSDTGHENLLSSPRLGIIFQQQDLLKSAGELGESASTGFWSSSFSQTIASFSTSRSLISTSRLQYSDPAVFIEVLGPVVFRVDSRIALNSTKPGGQQIEDIMYSLSYSLECLGSGKLVAWYSPKRKEGMVELRVFEF